MGICIVTGTLIQRCRKHFGDGEACVSMQAARRVTGHVPSLKNVQTGCSKIASEAAFGEYNFSFSLPRTYCLDACGNCAP